MDKGELYQKISHDDSKLLFEPMGKEKALISGLLYQNDFTKVYGNILSTTIGV
ncbi:MAG: hypothetical protein WBZ20_00905 [Nitrososphaeraceae archaeon]